VRDVVKGAVRPGMTYVETCELVEREIAKRGGAPAFPTGIGVNAVTAHYSPQEDDATRFDEADMIKVDFGVHVDGFVTDTAVTLTFNPEHEPLARAAERTLKAAVDTVKRERRTGEIGREIMRQASRLGFRTIENLTGHTVDRYVVHAGKSIPNIYMPNLPSLKGDEVFAIEPFLTLGSAAGYVVDSPSETIFSVVARRKTGAGDLDDFLSMVWNERKTLPFTPRWYSSRYPKQVLERILKELVSRRILRSYPRLVEASNKPVAQFEHTMAFEGERLVILT